MTYNTTSEGRIKYTRNFLRGNFRGSSQPDLNTKYTIRVAVEYNGKFLLVRRMQPHSEPELYEFAGGKMKKGETPFKVIDREGGKETGLDLMVEGFLATTEIEKYSRQKKQVIPITVQLYGAKTYSSEASTNDGEHDHHIWLPFEEIIERDDLASETSALVKKLKEEYVLAKNGNHENPFIANNLLTFSLEYK